MKLDSSDLLIPLYDGVFEKPLWASFLDRLRDRTKVSLTTLLFHGEANAGTIHLHSGRHSVPSQMEVSGQKFSGDPIPYGTMREGRVYALDELLDDHDPIHRGFRDEVLKPLDLNALRMIRIAEPGGLHAWLSCSGGKRVNWSGVSALLAALAPHLRQALRIFATLEQERTRSVVTQDVFDRLNFGWMTLNARCQIVGSSHHMDALLQRTSVLRRGRYDRLTLQDPKIDKRINDLVKTFAVDPQAAPQAINLSRDPLVDLLIRPVREESIAAKLPSVAVVYVSGDRLSQADRWEQLIGLFGLLPSEAKLAWAIAQGRSIAQAADDLGITIETARNYSKKIYAKTGSRGQAELVRHVLTSVMALA